MKSSIRKRLWFVLSALVLLGAVVVVISKSPSPARTEVSNPPAKADVQPQAAPPVEDWLARVEAGEVTGFAALLREILAIGDAEARQLAASALLHRWIREDREGLVAFFDALEVALDHEALANCYISLETVLSNLDEVLAADDHVFLLVQRLVSHLSETDPEKALAWASDWLLEDAREEALATVARGFAARDVPRALEVVERIASPLRRMQALAFVGARYAVRDRDAAVDWAGKLGNSTERALTMNSVVLAVAREDVEFAAAALQRTAKQIAGEYEEKRTAELARAGLTEADVANSTEVYLDLLENGGIMPPASPDVELLVEAGKVVANLFAGTDVPRGLAWAASFPEGYFRTTVLTGALSEWAASDPQAAVSHVTASEQADPVLLDVVFKRWAGADPAAAAEALEMIGNEGDRTKIAGTVIGEWAASGDADGVASYLATAEDTVPDAVRLAASLSLAEHHAADAWNIAMKITSPAMQAKALRRAFAHMIFADPGMADSALGGSALPADLAVELGEMLAGSGLH